MQAFDTPTSVGRIPALSKYEVLEEIGHGGMATVYRAHDKRLARDVALKVLHPHLRGSADAAHRFYVEAKAVAKLRHPNIVEVYDVSGEDEREQYLVVEFVRGRTLRQMLDEHRSLPPEIAAAIGIELLEALAHAHEASVVHRDIKPENVIIEHRARESRDGEPTQPGVRVAVKLTDFGIAKILDTKGLTATGQVLGSPAHMAPEQVEGGAVDARADLFGLGVLLYECMVGKLPFRGSNPAQVLRNVIGDNYPRAASERSAVGKRWSHILDRALAHDVDARFASAFEMREALRAELVRVGYPLWRAELEAFCDGPASYVERHESELVPKLLALGKQAREADDALGAAADLNRALAYAPTDANLLRLVAGLRRSALRAKKVRTAARVGAAALAAALVVLGVGRWRSQRVVSPARPPGESSSHTATPGPEATRPTATLSSTAASQPTGVVRPLAPIPAPLVRPAIVGTASVAAPRAQRDILVASTKPPFGVTVSVDGNAPTRATSGLRLTVDSGKHVLRFACVDDLCDVRDREIAAGEQDETIAVAMTIKPATLVVGGDARFTFSVVEEPALDVRADQPVRIPMAGAKRVVHVVEHPSNRTLVRTLIAGQENRVDFPSSDVEP